MLQLIIHGRGGQGAQLAGEILAAAFFAEGKYVQAYATYGGARRGTAVSSFVRVDDKPILLRCDIEVPDVVLCFDTSLLTSGVLQSYGDKTTVLVNTSRDSEQFVNSGRALVVKIDALGIARDNGLGRFVNSALIGACAGWLSMPSKASIIEVVSMRSPAKKEENAKVCALGYELAAQRRLNS